MNKIMLVAVAVVLGATVASPSVGFAAGAGMETLAEWSKLVGNNEALSRAYAYGFMTAMSFSDQDCHMGGEEFIAYLRYMAVRDPSQGVYLTIYDKIHDQCLQKPRPSVAR